jgi:prevent-host-death family protein
MPVYTVHDAKTNLSKLIERAENGEEVVIARGSKPAVKLVPIAASKPKRVFGAFKGQFSLPDSFFDPLPEDELAAWEGAFSEWPQKPAPRRSRKQAKK